MKWNPVAFITPCLSKTKKLLFPIDKEFWLKLGFVMLIAGLGTGSCSGVFNAESTLSPDEVDALKYSLSLLTVEVLLVAIGVSLLFYTGIMLLRNGFLFVGIDSVQQKKAKIMNSWRAYFSQSLSFTLFSMAMFVLIVGGGVGLFWSEISALINGQPINQEMLNMKTAVFTIFIVVVSAVDILLANFCFAHMYLKKKLFMDALVSTLPKMRTAPKPVLLFLLIKFAINILFMIAAIIILIMCIVILSIFVIIGVIFAQVIGLHTLVSVTALFVIVGVLSFVFMMYVLSVALLPFSVFSFYYMIENYKALMK